MSLRHGDTSGVSVMVIFHILIRSSGRAGTVEEMRAPRLFNITVGVGQRLCSICIVSGRPLRRCIVILKQKPSKPSGRCLRPVGCVPKGREPARLKHPEGRFESILLSSDCHQHGY